MAFPVPKTKIRDHFYRPNYPPKPRKNHLGKAFLPLESGFLAILFILHILVAFLECKKTKSAILKSKESSNQKMQENKLALKFNFT